MLDNLLSRLDDFLSDLHWVFWLNFDGPPMILDLIDKAGFVVRGFRCFLEHGFYDGSINYPYSTYVLPK